MNYLIPSVREEIIDRFAIDTTIQNDETLLFAAIKNMQTWRKTHSASNIDITNRFASAFGNWKVEFNSDNQPVFTLEAKAFVDDSLRYLLDQPKAVFDFDHFANNMPPYLRTRLKSRLRDQNFIQKSDLEFAIEAGLNDAAEHAPNHYNPLVPEYAALVASYDCDMFVDLDDDHVVTNEDIVTLLTEN